jgi:drug/metabolite transporter (DMT)-like permease
MSRGVERATRRAIVALIVVNALWGSSYAVIKVTVERAPPLTTFAICVVVAAALLWSIRARRPRGPAVPRGDALRMAALGNLGITFPLGLLFQGVVWAPATDAALMIVGETIFMVALGVAFLGERVDRRRVTAVALGVLGIVLVVLGGDLADGGGDPAMRLLGDLLMLAATLGDALYNVAGAAMARRHDPLTLLTWATTGALPPAVAVLAWASWTGALPAFDGPLLLGIAWVGGVHLVACFLLWFAALARVGAVTGGVSVTLQPLAGIVLGVFVLGEALSLGGALGGALIILAISLSATRAAERP